MAATVAGSVGVVAPASPPAGLCIVSVATTTGAGRAVGGMVAVAGTATAGLVAVAGAAVDGLVLSDWESAGEPQATSTKIMADKSRL